MIEGILKSVKLKVWSIVDAVASSCRVPANIGFPPPPPAVLEGQVIRGWSPLKGFLCRSAGYGTAGICSLLDAAFSFSSLPKRGIS